MKKLFILFIISFLFLNNLSAQESSEGIKTWLEEEDGSPSIIVYKTKVSNNTLTDNLDGTASLTTAGGSTSFDNTAPKGVLYINVGNTASASTLMVTDGANLSLGVGTTANASRLYIRGAGTSAGFALRIADSIPTDRLVVLDNGNVGIGTTGPGSVLDIYKDSNTAAANLTIQNPDGGNTDKIFSIQAYGGGINGGEFGVNTAGTVILKTTSTQGGFMGILTTSNDPVLFGTNNLERIRIASSGNVGIATTAPVALLQVGTSPTPGLVVTAPGNVGIGTTGPGNPLEISKNAAGADYLLKLRNNNGAANDEVGITFDANDDGGISRQVGGIAAAMTNNTNSGSHNTDLVFRVETAQSFNERMRIKGSGNVGIGTTAPFGLLQVGTSPNAPLVVLAAGNVGIGNTAPITLLQVGTSPNVGLMVTSAGNVGIGTSLPVGLLQVGTSPGTAALTVTGGNIGIGKTNPTAKVYIFAATTAPTATLAIIGSGTGAGLTGGIVLKASNGTCGYGTLADGTGPLNWLSVTCP